MEEGNWAQSHKAGEAREWATSQQESRGKIVRVWGRRSFYIGDKRCKYEELPGV